MDLKFYLSLAIQEMYGLISEDLVLEQYNKIEDEELKQRLLKAHEDFSSIMTDRHFWVMPDPKFVKSKFNCRVGLEKKRVKIVRFTGDGKRKPISHLPKKEFISSLPFGWAKEAMPYDYND